MAPANLDPLPRILLEDMTWHSCTYYSGKSPEISMLGENGDVFQKSWLPGFLHTFHPRMYLKQPMHKLSSHPHQQAPRLPHPPVNTACVPTLAAPPSSLSL